MKVLGFITIHYGKEYLKESLFSVVSHVDKMVVAYSKYPSHGHGTKRECPDSEEEIYKICHEVLGDKLLWDRVEMHPNEGAHRNVRYKYAQGYDLILTIDADEVYEGVPAALEYAYTRTERYFGIDGYINFWRSFNYACYDGFRPIRIENLSNHNQVQNHGCRLTVYHFSTCQSEPVMRYKYKVFGHASEMRANWLDAIYYAWRPDNDIQDIHPVAFGLWNTVKFDKETLPSYLKEHPNFNKTLV